MASRKYKFAKQVMEYCTFIAQNADFGSDARDVYNDRGYPPTGSDPITDEDIEELEITAADLELAMQFFENLGTMLGNGSPTTADYDKTLNLMRKDL